MPRLDEVAVDFRVLAVCALASLVVGIVTGLVPALRYGAQDVSEALKHGAGRTVSAGGGRSRLALVSAQLALALVLAVGATLLFESFLRVRSVETGFDPSDLVTFSMPLKTPATADGPARVAWDGLMREVQAVPGIEVAAGSNLPFESPNWAPGVLLPGEPDDTRRTGIAGYVVTPGYLDVLGIPLLEGRDLTTTDGPDAESVVLVNAAFVREVLESQPAVGRTIRFRGEEGGFEELRVVGVVGDLVQTRAEDPKQPAVYVPYTQLDWSYSARVVVRTERELESLEPDLRQAAARFFPAYPIRDLTTMRARIGSTRTEPRFQAMLLIAFAAIALLLAAIGLYGSLSHMVGRRTRELGIRMVLGADRTEILGLVFSRGGAAVGIGMATGLAGALLLTRFLRGFLFGIGAFHLPAFLWAVVLLTGLAALAVVGPARRALKVDLVESLRSE
jgi:predicted permease